MHSKNNYLVLTKGRKVTCGMARLAMVRPETTSDLRSLRLYLGPHSRMGNTYWAARMSLVLEDCPLNWRRGSSGKKVSFSRAFSFSKVERRGGGATRWTSVSMAICTGWWEVVLLAFGSIYIYIYLNIWLCVVGWIDYWIWCWYLFCCGWEVQIKPHVNQLSDRPLIYKNTRPLDLPISLCMYNGWLNERERERVYCNLHEGELCVYVSERGVKERGREG